MTRTTGPEHLAFWYEALAADDGRCYAGWPAVEEHFAAVIERQRERLGPAFGGFTGQNLLKIAADAGWLLDSADGLRLDLGDGAAPVSRAPLYRPSALAEHAGRSLALAH